MKKALKCLVSIILVLSMIMSATVVAFADSSSGEVYLSELRLIYAYSYEEAKQIMAGTKLTGYQVLDANLNSNTGEIGVWLAYKTTTDIDDAITDLAVMQMGGGYSEGNYQEMIKQSKEEYTAMGLIYLEAIEYFAAAYAADDFLASSAYRQLNFYTGVDNYKGDRLGDLFVDEELTEVDLATIFFQGNSYALKNIRSLLAIGVSYNEEGLHYLQRVSLLASGTYSGYVGEDLEDLTADDIEVYVDDDDLDQISALIAPNIPVFRNMFEELSVYEDELNYEDEEFTDLEIQYSEYKAMADMMRAVDYLNGQSLYDFCMNYSLDTNDYTSIYPLAKALNQGQVSMTKVMHYYDVVRYSANESPEELIDAQLSALEEKYSEKPFDIYTGVDRSMYNGTFALTSAASRADAYTDSTSLAETMFGNGAWVSTSLQATAGVVGTGMMVWAIARTAKGGFGASKEFVQRLTDEAMKTAQKAGVEAANNALANVKNIDGIINRVFNALSTKGPEYLSEADQLGFGALTERVDKLEFLRSAMEAHPGKFNYNADYLVVKNCLREYDTALAAAKKDALEPAMASVRSSVLKARLFTGALYIVGALATAYSAISLYNKVMDHYHPTYDEIPEAMVDLIDTVDGDRYIKYDVVLEATKKTDGNYAAGDLNAFAAQRWNALYYTKSYEAGKPLLADFVLNNSNNRAEEGYLAVHRFGEIVCYDLNKYNFKNASDMIFLSVAQSENQKSAVSDVPEVVGSMFGNGLVFLVGGIGVVVGVGGSLGIQQFLDKKKRSKADSEAAEA